MRKSSASSGLTLFQVITVNTAYDLAGNMTSDGSNALTYDAENRVTNSVNGGASGAYVFDGNSLRVQKTVQSRFMWEANSLVVNLNPPFKFVGCFAVGQQLVESTHVIPGTTNARTPN